MGHTESHFSLMSHRKDNSFELGFGPGWSRPTIFQGGPGFSLGGKVLYNCCHVLQRQKALTGQLTRNERRLIKDSLQTLYSMPSRGSGGPLPDVLPERNHNQPYAQSNRTS